MALYITNQFMLNSVFVTGRLFYRCQFVRMQSERCGGFDVPGHYFYGRKVLRISDQPHRYRTQLRRDSDGIEQYGGHASGIHRSSLCRRTDKRQCITCAGLFNLKYTKKLIFYFVLFQFSKLWSGGKSSFTPLRL